MGRRRLRVRDSERRPAAAARHAPCWWRWWSSSPQLHIPSLDLAETTVGRSAAIEADVAASILKRLEAKDQTKG